MDKFSKDLTFVTILVIALLLIFFLQGCTPFKETVDTIRDPDMTVGCYVREGAIGFDSYFQTTKAQMETCKLKCSKELPPNFTYEYTNPRTGCSVKIGAIQ